MASRSPLGSEALLKSLLLPIAKRRDPMFNFSGCQELISNVGAYSGGRPLRNPNATSQCGHREHNKILISNQMGVTESGQPLTVLSYLCWAMHLCCVYPANLLASVAKSPVGYGNNSATSHPVNFYLIGWLRVWYCAPLVDGKPSKSCDSVVLVTP